MNTIVDQLTSEVNQKSITISNLEIEVRLLQQTRKIAEEDLAGLSHEKDEARDAILPGRYLSTHTRTHTPAT